MRIVSLLPSATELLCAAGGERLLVGRSHECDFPPSIAHLPILTAQRTAAATSAEIDRQVRAALSGPVDGIASASLYSLDAAILVSLKPDVILTQDLCEVCSVDLHAVRAIADRLSPRPEIVSLNPASLESVFDDLLTVGRAAGLEAGAEHAMVGLRAAYWDARDFVNPYLEGPEVAFLEWMDPLFAGGHWTPQLIEAAGGRHRLNPAGATSRQIEPEELLAAMPDRLIICPCGYDLAAIRRELDTLTSARWWPLLPAARQGHVALVDGSQMFSRPGPRLIEAFRWLVAWLNDRPEVMPRGFPAEILGTR